MPAISRRSALAFLYAVPISLLGGLMGLGGAEFRLPVLAGPLGYKARQTAGLGRDRGTYGPRISPRCSRRRHACRACTCRCAESDTRDHFNRLGHTHFPWPARRPQVRSPLGCAEQSDGVCLASRIACPFNDDAAHPRLER